MTFGPGSTYGKDGTGAAGEGHDLADPVAGVGAGEDRVLEDAVARRGLGVRGVAVLVDRADGVDVVQAGREERMAIRRAWKSRKFEHELTSSQRSTPGAQTSRSYFLAWTKPSSRVLMSRTR